jgi:hypothetical protein
MLERNRLYRPLPEDERCEEENIYTEGDSILNQFYLGNFQVAIECMVKSNINAYELLDYVETEDFWADSNYYEKFDKKFFIDVAMHLL